MERTRAFRRKKNYSKAIRKKHISDSYGSRCDSWYKHLGQYIKGKIHCSCLACSSFSKTNSKRRWSKGKKNYKHSDRKKFESMNAQLKEGEF